MRIIGGTARGRQLATFTGRQVRPTPDRVREALFNILFSRRGSLAGLRALDLFAGTGALGIEALSHGARHVWFVDQSRQAVQLIRENLRRCAFQPRATVIERDLWPSLPALAEDGPFDLILADPPYGQELGLRLLTEVDAHALLAGDGLLCLETAAADPLPDRAGALIRVDERRYGRTAFHLYERPVEATS